MNIVEKSALSTINIVRKNGFECWIGFSDRQRMERSVKVFADIKCLALHYELWLPNFFFIFDLFDYSFT